MKKFFFGLITTVISIGLTCAALEVTAIVWLYLEEGKYTPADELFQRTQNTYVRDLTKGTSCRYVDTLYPHPYVAFVHHGNPPCGPANVNNVGLFNEDFPTIKRTDRYVVLVVGGSVSSQLAQNWAPPAPKYLEEELNKKYVSPNGKPFLILNGGDGAWKEPQSFILFSLYASSVDAVMALDGYNEHYMFRSYTEERLERPLSNFADVNPFVADENFGDAAIGWVMGRIAGGLAHTPILGHSHAAYMVVRGIEAAAKGKDMFKSTKKTTLESLFSLPREIKGNGEAVFETQLALYQKYERAIEAVAKDNGVKTAYFFQPVPTWGKTLTAEEKGFAARSADPVLYRRIVDGMMKLRDKGLAMYDLGDVFKDVPEQIYADDIHCFRDDKGESKGYRIMATRVAADLAQAWELKAK
ncbi:MAG TPA: hypothetical protein VMI56_18945 [Reyranella sp.]|nr:hypothetical protein [Reyranella sp.]